MSLCQWCEQRPVNPEKFGKKFCSRNCQNAFSNNKRIREQQESKRKINVSSKGESNIKQIVKALQTPTQTRVGEESITTSKRAKLEAISWADVFENIIEGPVDKAVRYEIKYLASSALENWELIQQSRSLFDMMTEMKYLDVMSQPWNIHNQNGLEKTFMTPVLHVPCSDLIQKGFWSDEKLTDWSSKTYKNDTRYTLLDVILRLKLFWYTMSGNTDSSCKWEFLKPKLIHDRQVIGAIVCFTMTLDEKTVSEHTVTWYDVSPTEWRSFANTKNMAALFIRKMCMQGGDSWASGSFRFPFIDCKVTTTENPESTNIATSSASNAVVESRDSDSDSETVEDD